MPSTKTYDKYKDSGVEWIGKIPECWKTIKFKYCFDIIGGNGFPEALQGNEMGDIPFCKCSDINGNSIFVGKANNYISCECSKDYKFNIIPKNSILIAKIGEALKKNHRKINSLECCIDNNMEAFVFKTNADKLFYYNVLKCIDMLWFDNGGTIPSVNNEKLKNFKLPYIPIIEQQQIADYLDKKCGEIDRVVDTQKDVIEKLKEYKQSVITEAVTKGLDKSVPLKASGIEWIGEIPQHWEVRKLKTIGVYRNGLTYSPEDLCEDSKGTLVLRSSNIKNGKLILGDNVYVKSNIPEALIVQKGDILICSRNGSKELIGKNAIINENVNASFGAFMMIFRCNYPEYMYYILNSHIFNYYLGSFFTSTINQLTGKNFGDMDIVFCPKKKEQDLIVEYLDKKCSEIDSAISDKEQLIEKLTEYKKSLIYECVTGKRKVVV